MGCDEVLVSQLMSLVVGQTKSSLEIPLELKTYPGIDRGMWYHCITADIVDAHSLVGYGAESLVDAHVKFAVKTVERRLGQKLQPRYALQMGKLQQALHKFEHAVESETEDLRELWTALYVDGTYHEQGSNGLGIDMHVEAERCVYNWLSS